MGIYDKNFIRETVLTTNIVSLLDKCQNKEKWWEDEFF